MLVARLAVLDFEEQRRAPIQVPHLGGVDAMPARHLPCPQQIEDRCRVRAALVTDLFTAQMSKEHNNANIICLGGRVLKDALAKKALGLWLDTPFAGDRHARRLKKIQQIERKNFK